MIAQPKARLNVDGQMNEKPAPKAGAGSDRENLRDRHASRRPFLIGDPPAHAGIVAALRTAFGDGVRAPDNDDDVFAKLLARLN